MPRQRALAALFAALTMAQLAPVWSAQYLPTGDGPSHLYGAWLLRELTLHRNAGVIASYYHIAWQPVPNFASYAFIAAALSVLTPLAAEKLFFSLVVITFLAGAWMFAGADDPGNVVYAFLALPLTFNQLLQAGFYNFSLSAGLYLITVAFFWRHRHDSRWQIVTVTALLLLLCYFGHAMAAILGVFSISILWLCSVRRSRHLLAFLPTIALLLWFFGRERTAQTVWPSRGQLVGYLTRTELLYTFDPRQIVFGRVFFVLVAALLIATFCVENLPLKIRARDGFLLIVLALIALYFLSPADTAGGAVINQRLALFVIVSPMPWFSRRFGRLLAVPLAVIFSLIAIVNAGCQLRHFRQSSRNTARCLTAAQEIAPNSVVLPLLFTRSMPDAYIGYHVHAIEYIAIEKHLVDLGFYQPGTDYFPIRYNTAVRRPDILEIEGHPDRVHLSDYPSANYVFTYVMPSDSPVRS